MIIKPEGTWNKCPSSWEQLINQTLRFRVMFLWKCFQRCVGVFARSVLHQLLWGQVLPAPDGRCVARGLLSRDSQGWGGDVSLLLLLKQLCAHQGELAYGPQSPSSLLAESGPLDTSLGVRMSSRQNPVLFKSGRSWRDVTGTEEKSLHCDVLFCSWVRWSSKFSAGYILR